MTIRGSAARIALPALLLAQLTGAACVVGPGGGFESLSGGGTGGDETGFPPEPAECNFDLGANPLGESACTQDEDCCATPTAALDYACPSDVFPNNWRCESGVCRQRTSPSADEGCSVNNDLCIFPGFTCVEIFGVGHCVAPCTATVECQTEHNMPDSTCQTVDGNSFCMQPQP